MGSIFCIRGGSLQGDYQITASLNDAGYILANDASPLAVTVQVGGAESYNLTMPSGEPPFSDHIVNGVSPNGTTINLFDYWLTSQDASDNSDPSGIEDLGINKDHTLKFFKNGLGGWNQINSWTNSKNPNTGLAVGSLMDGYPMLANGNNESLNYLFDPGITHEGKASYQDVQGLLQVDDDGYYYYDSQQNYAVYYSDANSFTLYDNPGVIPGGSSPVGQFFPFNEATANAVSQNVGGKNYSLMSTKKSTDASINHWFGMHMSTRFIQQYGGYTADPDDGGKPVTYEFSGDDDVWIYIDGVLVGDLGGIHDAASIKIDFSTGEITINGQKQNKTLGSLLGLDTATLADDTYHTLDFFYLERGNYDSNMSLKYNLVTIPESGVIKVDQVGNPVYGAEFSLYAADDYQEKGDAATPVAVGTTDNSGKFTFIKEENNGDTRPITIGELYDLYGDSKDDKNNNLVLVETETPAGYRTCGAVGLYFYASPNNSDEVMLLSSDEAIWSEGAYAMPKVTATTGNVIKILNDPNDVTGSGSLGNIVNLVGSGADEDPVMFAVIFKKGDDGKWCPVSGDPIGGWTVESSNDWDTILSVAKKENYTFQLSSSGAYQVELDNLPGNIQKYYHICKNIDEAQYTIAYYYTKAPSLSEASESDTFRIDPDVPLNDGGLSRTFSMELYITNMKNRLLVQKVDDGGNPVDGVRFSLCKASEVTVGPDGEVTPNEDASPAVVTTGTVSTPISLEGAAVFPDNVGTGAVLENGEYWLVETSAPTGYSKKTDPVHVVVDNTGVYADAGEADDGVTVLRGVGSVARSMIQFAADDRVDVTLRDIKAALATSVQYKGYSEDGSFGVDGTGINWGSSSGDVLHLKYANSNKMLDYVLQDSGGGSTLDDLTLSTDVGWSKLLIRQDYKDGDADNALKTNLGDRDITNLFSGTVTVRVENDRTGNLKISKRVTGDGAPQGKVFTFEVKLTKGGTPVTGTYETKDADGKKSTVTFKDDGTATISVESGKSFTILALPTGASYTVTEQNVPDHFTPSVTVDNGQAQDSVTATGTIGHNIDTDSATTVAYTNTFDGSTVLQLKGEKILRGKNITAGDSFTFELTSGDETTSGAIDAGAIVMPGQTSVTVSGNGTSESANFEFGDIRFKTEGTYTFNITEKRPEGTDGQSTSNGDVWYDTHITKVTVEVTRDDETGLLSAVPTYDNSENPDSSTNTDQAEFVNRYAGIKITKKVSGAMGDKDKDFNFVITVTDSSGPALTGSYPCTINGAESTLDLDENGQETFQLKDAETIVIYGLPVGSTCKVEESNAKEDGYTTTVTVGDDVQQNTYQATATLSGDKTIEITFENSRNDVPATGISIDSWPWVLAAAAVVVSGIALIRITRRGSRGGHFAA